MDKLIDTRTFPEKLRDIRTLKNLIIQRGPQLIRLDSFEKTRSFKISIKRINLNNRPISLQKTYKTTRSIISPRCFLSKQRFNSGTTSPKNYSHTFLQTTIMRPSFFFEQNPFQNEALKSPLSKRSFTKGLKYHLQ